MESFAASTAFATLGHEGRLAVFRLLMRHAPQGVAAGEIAAALGLKANTASVYLKALAQAGLIRAEREGRCVLYAADLGGTAALIGYFLADCCRGRPDLCLPSPAAEAVDTAAPRRFNVLFLCSGNSARSIFAEAILAELGAGRFTAWSAGTQPRGGLHPMAVEVLRRHGHDLSRLRPKPASEFRRPGAPVFDFVFTVCDTAAHEDCAAWPGQPITAHWGMPDPASAEGTDTERAIAFARSYGALNRRIAAFVALPVAALERVALQHRLDAIGRGETDGDTA